MVEHLKLGLQKNWKHWLRRWRAEKVTQRKIQPRRKKDGIIEWALRLAATRIVSAQVWGVV